MNRLNLSEWALSHRSFVIFIMIVSMLAGAIAFRDLGRNEDPPFTFRTMVVQAAWPGATMDETLLQVTERLERKLQETNGLDSLRSITVPGRATIFVNLRGDTSPKQVEDTWYRVRRDVADIRHTLPAGIVGPGFNDSFGDTFGLIYGFNADGFTHRELRDQVEIARSRLLLVPDVSIIDLIGAQEERVHIEFSVDQLAALGLNQAQLLTALAAQNVVRPAGTVITDQERLTVRVSGVFDSEEDILDVNFVSNGRLVRLRDIATVKRELADPPQPMFRVNGKPSIGLAIAMRDGGDVLALGKNIASAMREITAELPVGIEATLVANQPEVVDEAINDFMLSLWQSIAIILAVSFITLGVRPGAVVATAIPITLATVFLVMQTMGIDLHRVSLGALIIALALLVDDAMTTTDAMLRRLAVGDTVDKAATYAYSRLAAPMLTGTLITIAGFIPIGFAESQAGEYTISLFQVVAIALIASWFVAVLYTPILGAVLLRPPKPGAEAKPSRIAHALHCVQRRLDGVRVVRRVVEDQVAELVHAADHRDHRGRGRHREMPERVLAVVVRARVDQRHRQVGDQRRVVDRAQPLARAAQDRRHPQRPVARRVEDVDGHAARGQRHRLPAEHVDVEVRRHEDHRLELGEELRRPGERHAAQRLHQHHRAHGMRGDDDIAGVRARQRLQRRLQPLAGEDRALAVEGVGLHAAARGPRIMHREPRRAKVVAHLGVAIEALGEVGVEPVGEDQDLALGLRLGGKPGVDRPDEPRRVAEILRRDGDEVGPRVGRQAVGKGDGAL